MSVFKVAKEYGIQCLREVAVESTLCDDPAKVAEYWRTAIASDARYNPDVEQFAVLFLNTRKRVTGHVVVSVGTLDSIQVHPREVFRSAVIAAAHSIVLMHNHPSGDSTPSDADVRVTRDLRRAGDTLKIDVLDHVIVGQKTDTSRGYTSLRELGYFYN